jgi:glucan phosphorylase
MGAVVLGIGLGVLAADRLGRVGLPLLLVGLVVHAWGMFDKHRLERQANAPDVWWASVTYWTCWMLLAVLGIGLASRLTGII